MTSLSFRGQKGQKETKETRETPAHRACRIITYDLGHVKLLPHHEVRRGRGVQAGASGPVSASVAEGSKTQLLSTRTSETVFFLREEHAACSALQRYFRFCSDG